MLILNLLWHLATRNALFLVFSLALFGGFEFLVCAIVSTVNVSGAVTELMKSVPPFMQSLIGDEFFASLTTRGILAFGWNHPVAQASGTAVAIMLATRAFAGEIESGVMELLLSQPLSRMHYLVGQIVFALGALTVLSLAGIGGTILGQKFFKLEAFEIRALLRLSLNFFLLQSGWYGLTLAFSVFGRESSRVAGGAFLVALMSYLVQAIGRLWPPAAMLLPYSLHTYYSPQEILVKNTPVGGSLAVLFGVLVAGVGLAAWRFGRRDVP